MDGVWRGNPSFREDLILRSTDIPTFDAFGFFPLNLRPWWIAVQKVSGELHTSETGVIPANVGGNFGGF